MPRPRPVLPSRRPPATRRALAGLVAIAALTLSACSSGGAGEPPASAAERTPAPTTTTHAATAPTTTTARTFTTVGNRAGFAHGFELVRRESDAEVAADLDRMAATGARWLRVTIEWDFVEPERGVYDWAGTDRVVQGARARGMSVVGLITYAPGWATVRGCGSGQGCRPRDPADLGAFATVAAQRYLPLGVHHWEIWNEPNVVQFFQPRPDPAAYADLLRAAHGAIHTVDPEAVVISGGLAPAPDAGVQWSPKRFLGAVYDAGGGPAMDAVGVHPYSFPLRPGADVPTNAFMHTPDLHDVMTAHGDGAKQIWGTEFGVPTRGSSSVPEREQGAHAEEAYAIWNGWAFTGPLLWYTMRDLGTGPRIEDSYGLVREDGTPKPGLATFTRIMTTGDPVPVTAR